MITKKLMRKSAIPAVDGMADVVDNLPDNWDVVPDAVASCLKFKRKKFEHLVLRLRMVVIQAAT